MEENFIGEEERWFHCFELKQCVFVEDVYLKSVENKMKSHKAISNITTIHKSLSELKGESSSALSAP